MEIDHAFPVSVSRHLWSVLTPKLMHSASLTSVLRVERLLEAADEILSEELARIQPFWNIHKKVAEVLQQVTTERIRIQHDPTKPASTG